MPDRLANAHDSGAPSPADPPQKGRTSPFALYGAGGVTGRLVLAAALRRGHRPTLIGRDLTKLHAIAEPHGLPVKEARLDDPAALANALAGRSRLLNVAGPFTVTGPPLIDAALNAGVSYADVNGELAALERLLALDEIARRRGIALVGGAGFGVAASDGLVGLVDAALGGADWLRIGVAAASAYRSPAVAQSTLAVLAGGGREVRDGQMVRRRLAARRWTPSLQDGARLAFASAPLAELAAARRVAPAKDIVAGVPMPVGQAAALSLIAPLLPSLLRIPAVGRAMASAGGHAASSTPPAAYRSRIFVEGGRGARRVIGRLEGGEGYALAAELAVLAVEAMAGSALRGAHTPASAFGLDFIRQASGVTITVAEVTGS